MNNKTEMKKDWGSVPYLKPYTATKYYAVMGCYLLGFDLESITCTGFYRTNFKIFPLWKKSVKDCFHYPFVYISVKDNKNLDYDIPYINHHCYFIKLISYCKEQFEFIFHNDINAREIYNFFYHYSKSYYINNLRNKVLLFECELFFSLYMNNLIGIEKVLNRIEEDSDKLNMKKMDFWGKTYDEWLESLISMTNDRDTFLKQIEININSEKLRKLPRYNLIP